MTLLYFIGALSAQIGPPVAKAHTIYIECINSLPGQLGTHEQDCFAKRHISTYRF